MPRVKGGYVTRRRRKRVLKLAKGYFGSKHILYKTAQEQVMKSLWYSFRDRKQTKRNFRKLWITRINAACRLVKISYSQFMHGLKLANIDVNRKMLADLAINDINGFNKLVEIAKDAIANPAKYQTVTKVEAKLVEVKREPRAVEEKPEVKVEAKPAVKVEPKVEPKVETVKEEVIAEQVSEDLSKLTVAQLKDLAKERGVTVPSTARKADIIELLSK